MAYCGARYVVPFSLKSAARASVSALLVPAITRAFLPVAPTDHTPINPFVYFGVAQPTHSSQVGNVSLAFDAASSSTTSFAHGPPTRIKFFASVPAFT